MKAAAHLPLKAKPVIGTFMTYVYNAGKHRGELMEIDFKVKGKSIEYKYTRLKTRS
jgi:hypothetical protein